MATKVYGSSDDLIEFEGDVYGEISPFSDKVGAHIRFSDNTLLHVKYGEDGIWKIDVLKKGELLERVDPCTDADAFIYSDIVHFRDGLKQAWFVEKWVIVR